MRPTTGTSVYTLLKCRKAVALDLAGDRSLRRPARADEEFVLQRGRDHEARIVAALGWPEPKFEPGEWQVGAAITEQYLRDGVIGVSQAVLIGPDQLGIPDLLRREPGKSRFGDHHYVVGDIKSSANPRSDQVLQVAFYSRMLAELQGRTPDYGYIVLKDGREERFDLVDFAPALRQVECEIDAIRADPEAVRPFFSIGCEHCNWSDVCGPELEARDDLSLLPGMTRAMRGALADAGVSTGAALAAVSIETLADRTGFEPALLRRLALAATARRNGHPVLESRAVGTPRAADAIVHLLRDPFADRVLYLGVLYPADESGEIHDALPSGRDDEWGAFERLIRALPPTSQLLHYGGALPAWHEEHAHGKLSSTAFECRFVDLARQLRGAAVFPGPVFGVADHVRFGLGRDPHHAGRVDAAALYASLGDDDWLRHKGRADLYDLAALKAAFLDPDRAAHGPVA